jgi:hypothetical protein
VGHAFSSNGNSYVIDEENLLMVWKGIESMECFDWTVPKCKVHAVFTTIGSLDDSVTVTE